MFLPGAEIVMPPVPVFYHKPWTADEIVEDPACPGPLPCLICRFVLHHMPGMEKLYEF